MHPTPPPGSPVHGSPPRRWRFPLLGTVVALLVAAPHLPLASASPEAADVAGDEVRIEVLSTRADLVTGGTAYVEVVVPADADPRALEIEVSHGDGPVEVPADAFAVRDDGRYLGLLEGLGLGDNEVVARLPDGRGAHLTVRNHPIEGPVFSGPHVAPWTCVGSDDAFLDEHCNRETRYELLYRSSNPLRTGWQSYDPGNPPGDVATTTTDEGHEVPFVVRVERGVTVRDNYAIAVLYDPEQPWEPWAPQEAFNHKLVITHGASCDTSYQQGSAPDVLDADLLGAGYIVMSHALNNAGHNCNVVTQAESMIVTKEHLIETYGELRYTIGSGCSGGALAQLQVANAYPGLYQGITPACSYPDAWSSAMQYVDYYKMLDYFQDPGRWAPGVVWEPTQIQQMIGHPNPTNPITFTTVIPFSGRPDRSCPGVPSGDVYHPEDNPEGVRCTLHDYMRNVFGVQPDGHPQAGWARRPADNVGVLYGLEGLLAGTLLPQNFVDMNVKIGGLDADARHTDERSPGDEVAIRRAYESGAVNTASNLDQVAIIDLRGPDPGAFHDVYRTYALRERLIREHGHAENQILWRGSVALFGDVTFVNEAVFAMSRWLDAVEADDRDVPLARKIVESRPDSVTHRCTSGAGQDLPAVYCDQIVEAYSTPRQAAGMPATDDVLKCELKPLRRADFHGVTFTDAQWQALTEAFPHGVCDYTRPDPNFTTTVPWMTYEDGPGTGRPLGDPPASRPLEPAPGDEDAGGGDSGGDRGGDGGGDGGSAPGQGRCPSPRSNAPACRLG